MIKLQVAIGYYDQKGTGEFIYIDPPSWMERQTARLRTALITCSISPKTVYDSAGHSTELIQISCGQLPTRAVTRSVDFYLFVGYYIREMQKNTGKLFLLTRDLFDAGVR